MTSETMRRPSQMMKLLLTSFFGVIVGFLMGITFPTLTLTKVRVPLPFVHHFSIPFPFILNLIMTFAYTVMVFFLSSCFEMVKMNLPSTLFPSIDLAYIEDKYSDLAPNSSKTSLIPLIAIMTLRLGLAIIRLSIYGFLLTVVVLRGYPRYIWLQDYGKIRLTCMQYIKTKQRYLVTFTVGYDQRKNIDAEEGILLPPCTSFSSPFLIALTLHNFTIMLFHYDGRASEWGKFEWSKRAIHVSIRKQTKWWYAKRFLHPDIVAPYEYIFIWDEDLGVEHFDSEKYLAVVKKHGLEISQPGLEPYEGLEVSIGRADHGLAQSNSFWAGYGRPQFINGSTGQKTNWHAEERNGWCSDSNLPPCAAFVEIMAPNAHEKIGVVDAQWIVHQGGSITREPKFCLFLMWDDYHTTNFGSRVIGLPFRKRWLLQCRLPASDSGVAPYPSVSTAGSLPVSIFIGMAFPSPVMGWFIFDLICINKDDLLCLGISDESDRFACG
ncbi:hypothetical protein HID58_076806 [Brassica napus]|uniref:Uncharacterized protein n=1 Tax=Brassica napus TaxID=3708 RepID=A0ABQ7YNI6_BRANA|nr:hypothetical protein HID58_076806 [Brassica napus]